MTNELEKQFFNTFNIEPIGCNDNKNCTGALDCTQCPNAKYPQISDTHYLKLICILNTTNIVQLCTTNIENLKEEILMTACYWADKRSINYQVRTLFEEG